MEGTRTMNERTDSMREREVATNTQQTMPATETVNDGNTEDDLQGMFSVQDGMCHNFGDDDYDFEDEGMWAV